MNQFTRSKIRKGPVDLFNKLTTPAGVSPKSGLRYWQERVVLTILFTGLILGLFAYIPSIRLCIKEGLWSVAFFDTLIYLMVFVLFFFRQIPFSVRANAIIFSSFLLGLILLTIVGPGASGPVWLFTFPVLAGLIIGARASVYALILNLITLLIIGALIHFGYPEWTNPTPHTFERWIVISVNFILLNGITAMSLAMVFRGLQSSLDHEKSLRMSLEHEIGERIETEKSLKESEMRYRTIIQGAAEGIVIFDARMFEIIFVNHAICRMLGYEKESLPGKKIKTIFTNPDPNDSLPSGFNLEFQDKIHVNDYQLKCRDGSTIFTNLSNTKITVDKRDCIACFITDITDKKIEEIEKQKLQDHLQKAQKMESIGTLAGGIAHDFNNILSSVIGYTELALDDVEKESAIEEYLQEVYTAGNRARDLVKQILTFARQTDEEFKPVQVNLIAKEALKLLRASIPTSIEIKQDFDCETLVLADPTQIHQIFMNLCTNAAHAMEENGGVLEVKLSDKTFDGIYTIANAALKSGEYLKITIADTGSGISKENIATIFEPYFTTKAIGEGTGLGLSVVQGIVKNCGGEIIVESEVGKGTVFTIFLPVAKKRKEIESYAQEKHHKGTESILVVDDEVPIVKIISQTLQRLGYQVTSAAGSPEALELFKAGPGDFDLVITDMNMPQMSGEKLSAEMMRIRHDIPVILCSGYSKRISEEKAAEIGIRALLKKPVLKGILAEKVRKVLDEAKGKTQQ